MKITEIKYVERKNKGNFEHEEFTVTAVLDDGDDAFSSMLSLKTLVDAGLKTEHLPYQEPTGKNVEIAKEEPIVEAPVKEKKPRAKKVKEEVKPEAFETNTEVIPPVIEGEKLKSKKSKVVIYDRNILDHKSILSSHLNKTYGDAWKNKGTKEEITSFTMSLNGKDFLDEQGNIVESFLNTLEGYFGVPY
jgi:hypothetical protein